MRSERRNERKENPIVEEEENAGSSVLLDEVVEDFSNYCSFSHIRQRIFRKVGPILL